MLQWFNRLIRSFIHSLMLWIKDIVVHGPAVLVMTLAAVSLANLLIIWSFIPEMLCFPMASLSILALV